MYKSPFILMYHSISKSRRDSDVFDLHVSPANFDRQIRELSRTCEIVTLSDMMRDFRNGQLRPNTVALTFDDGYANNLEVAAPILRKFNAPATLFVCTGFLGRDSYWWDRLLETVFTATRFPRSLAGLPVDMPEADRLLTVQGDEPGPKRRRELAMQIWRALQPLDLHRIDAVLAGLEERLRPRLCLADLRPMRRDEVSAAAEVFDIGAHTVSHPPMGRIDGARLAREIAESKRDCERLSGRPVTAFAYPFGELDGNAVSEVARHFDIACTTREAVVTRHTKPVLIPRIHVRDCGAEALSATIERLRVSRLYAPIRMAYHAALRPRTAAARLAAIMSKPYGI